jgi:hypothetical protein
MIEDFKAISEILEGGIEDTDSEAGVNAPTASETAVPTAQLSFVDASGPAAVPTVQAETSTVNVEEASRPEQLTLF